MQATMLEQLTRAHFTMQDAQTDNDNNMGASTAVLDRPQEDEDARLDDGNNADRFAHYVAKDRAEEAMLTGRPAVALCGKVWVPKYNPSDFPICPECKRIFEDMFKE